MSTDILPHDKEAEQGVLGSILHNNAGYFDVVGLVEPEYFFSPAHREIFLAMRDLMDRQEPVDEITLVAQLRSVGRLDAVGGPVYVAELRDLTPAASNSRSYARIVREKWQARAFLSSSLDMQNRIRESGTLDGLDQHRQEIAEIIDAGQEDSDPVHIGELVEAWEQEFDKPVSESRQPVWTYLDSLDRRTGGLAADRPTVVAGRTGVGKTVLCWQIANENGLNGVPTLYLNLEMKDQDLVTRAISSIAKVDGAALRGKQQDMFQHADTDDIYAATGRIKGIPLWVHSPRRAIGKSQIESILARFIAKHGIRLVVVDHLSRLAATGRDEYERQTKRIRGLAELQTLYGVPFLIACQLNRSGSDEPDLKNLKGSGEIEECAGLVLILHDQTAEQKPGQNTDRNTNNPHSVDFIVAKNGTGPKGRIPAPMFYPATTHFEDQS